MSQEPNHTDATSSDDDGPLTVGDSDLPEDLQPSEDNPLAQPAGDDVPDDLLQQDARRSDSGTSSGGAATGDDDASGTSSSAASSEAEDDASSD